MSAFAESRYCQRGERARPSASSWIGTPSTSASATVTLTLILLPFLRWR
jgi:hypothetical protein